MADNSFDVVAKVDQQELSNALDMARKEIETRFDFKGANAEIKQEKESFSLSAPDDMKMRQLIDIIQSKMVKRDLGLKAFQFGKFESNVSGVVKCQVTVQNGLSTEQAKKITKMIKEMKIKVQAKLQGDSVRVSGKSKDELQAVQQKIRDADFDFHTSFDNYR